MLNLKFKFWKASLVFIVLSVEFLFHGCKFFNSLISPEETSESKVKINSLSLGKKTLDMKVGEMTQLPVIVKPDSEQTSIQLEWSYDSSIITCDTSSSWDVKITAIAEGQTFLKCSYDGYDSSCLVTVSGYAENYEVEPYIFSNTTILQLSPGQKEKVYVSLFGGTVADIDGFTWTNDNDEICSIEPTGQYCIISTKEVGYTRIKVTHSKSAYPYYIGVYVFADITKATYITTSDNIVSLNKGDKNQKISVSLVNGKESSNDTQFKWEIKEDDDSSPIKLEANANEAIITPINGGSCTISITHPDAAYPLEILCRIITVSKNVYIKPSSTVISLYADEPQTVICSLENTKEGEFDFDAFSYTLSDYNIAEIVSSIGNEVTLKGKTNGYSKLLIKHEKSEYAREVLIIVSGQGLDAAVDASCYITTSQNYIRTKVGGEGTKLNVSLKGGEDGDESKFIWTIKSNAADGSDSKVIDMDTANGMAVHARMASQTYIDGSAFIKPLKEGTATIIISHPKIYYPTEVLVRVLSENAILDESWDLLGQGIIKLINGTSTEYNVILSGSGVSESSYRDIVWECENKNVSINATGKTALITSPPLGSGVTKSYITVSHDMVQAPKKVLLVTADSAEDLESIACIYANQLAYRIPIGKTCSLQMLASGFPEEENFSQTVWTTSDASKTILEVDASNPLYCSVTGLQSGTFSVTGRFADESVRFSVVVYDEAMVIDPNEPYLTTAQNVIIIDEPGKTTAAYINAIKMPSNEYANIEWNCDSDVISVVPNGQKATITSNSEGEAIIIVSHPLSQNTLKIYVRVGSEYVLEAIEPVVYISSEDVLTMIVDDKPQKLSASLMNCKDVNTAGFKFTIDDSKTAIISSQTENGTAYITPIACGQAEITITHPKSVISKKVLVIVANSQEELLGTAYLTTASNVVAVGEGNSKTISVSVRNTQENILDGYDWSSSNSNVVEVLSTGSTAVITGKSVGTAIITVTNTKHCSYSLQIIAQCVNPIAAADSPYIQLSASVVNMKINGALTTISAELVGGDKSDNSNFTWDVSDKNICSVYGQNETGKIKALKKGTTYITVSHQKAKYSAQLLVVCEEEKESDCYISVATNIITMKPTDATKVVTASLVNGNATDKYGFIWTLDVYDVIDLVSTADSCSITPKQQGQCTITIRHPKSNYSAQIVVTVQQYSEFAFPNSSVTLTKGDVKFYTMQIPNTNMTTYVEYIVANNKICTVTGTKETMQITAVGAGTTTITARLVASNGKKQAECEMLVYVKDAPSNTIYITSNSTINTVNIGKSITLTANLSGTGVTSNDFANLKWTPNDNKTVTIAGLKNGYATGQSIYVTANKAGEVIITCSHDKAQSDLQFLVIIPENPTKSITLSKNSLTPTKGTSGTQLKATIKNSTSKNDYDGILWTLEWDKKKSAEAPCQIMGSGQTVTVYPLNVGTATIKAIHTECAPNSPKDTCTVEVKAVKSLDIYALDDSTKKTLAITKLMPQTEIQVGYTISPPDDTLNISTTIASDSDLDKFFTITDLGHDKVTGEGKLKIKGLRQGLGNVLFTTSNNVKSGLSVNVTWDYRFKVTGIKVGDQAPKITKKINTTPDNTVVISYDIFPDFANVDVEMIDTDKLKCTVDNAKHTVTVTAQTETTRGVPIQIDLKAMNPNNENEEFRRETIQAIFNYGKLTPVVDDYLAKFSEAFTTYHEETNTFEIGDNDQIAAQFKFKETKAAVDDIKFTLIKTKGAEQHLEIENPKPTKPNVILLRHNDPEQTTKEIKARLYKIRGYAYIPAWKYIVESLDTLYGVPESAYALSNWKDDLKSATFYWKKGRQVYDAIGIAHKNYWNGDNEKTTDISKSYWIYRKTDDDQKWEFNSAKYVRVCDYSYGGKKYTEDQFKRIAFWYYPGAPSAISCDSLWEYPYSSGSFGTNNTVSKEPGDPHGDNNPNAPYDLVYPTGGKLADGTDDGGQNKELKEEYKLRMEWNHNEKVEYVDFPVQVLYRMCNETGEETDDSIFRKQSIFSLTVSGW